jgi:hypothetical protein
MSKMRKTILGLIAGVATIATASISSAVTGGNGPILFPYINSNTGNVSTVVSIITVNKAAAATSLHYKYFTKASTAAFNTCCLERDFTRPTTNKDIVSFDVAGHLASGSQGRALFNDATSYNAGAGAPRFDLPNLGLTDARRGYLLVAQSNTEGIIEYFTGTTDGEAMVIDIPNGAAWSYRAVWNARNNNANTPTGYVGGVYSDNGTSISSAEAAIAYSFNGNASTPANGVGLAVATNIQVDALYEGDPQPVAIYPPNEFETAFFVTPLNGTSQDLRSGNTTAYAGLYYAETGNLYGVFDRNENPVSGGQQIAICCTARIALTDFAGNANYWGSWFLPQGGWAYIRLNDAAAAGSAALYNAIVFKLQYGANSTLSPGRMINAADLVKSFRGDYFTNR